MARTLHVYPKAIIEGSTWTFVLKVHEVGVAPQSKFVHSVAAGVTAEIPLRLLKLGFDLVVADTDTDQDVDDALFVDDIRPGPQTETVWGNWQNIAEGIISGLATGYGVTDFWAAWRRQDTSSVRSDARRALVTQRGWTVVSGSVHQHEGDGAVTNE